MAVSHKLSLLYMLRILLEKTDEEHALNAAEIIRELRAYDCEEDRRTIYANAEILEEFGVDIIRKEDGHPGYYIGSRDFELPELKLLVDAVQSSRFITEKKSEELIRKLMGETSVYKAKLLNRAVFIRNRGKTGNEKVFYNVDALHDAMNEDRQIAFRYGDWTVGKRFEARGDGRVYTASPWALTWDDENYYLISYDAEADGIRHFRVDKMMEISILEDARLGREQFRDFDLAAFAKKTFSMFGGRDAEVSLRCANALAGVIIDRFGRDVMLIPDGEGHFRVRITAAVSPPFYGWVAGFGDRMEILSPEPVREEFREYLLRILGKYNERS